MQCHSQLKEDVSLTPYIKYVGTASDLDTDSCRVHVEGNDDLFYGGVTLSIAF